MKTSAAIALGALIVCGATIVSGTAMAAADDQPARAEFHHSYALSRTGSVSLDDAEGSMHVIAWDKAEVQIDALECAPTQDDLKALAIGVDATPDSIVVQTTFPRITSRVFNWSWLFSSGHHSYCDDHAAVDYTVRVPRQAHVTLTSVSADMQVTGPLASASTQTTSGDLSVTGAGDVSAQSTSGDVTLWRARGRLTMTTSSGDVHVNDSAGDITIDTTSGDVQMVRMSGKAAVTTTSGDITARSFSGLAHLSSTSGDVSMTLVPAKGLALSASSVSGDIHSDVPLSGKAPLDIHTVSGDILVRSL